mmetsp:Transcript_13757/g.16103  ORF Transcript_13757/g.16103 Transcript_13757/m.16103 type:complete len:245 (+) Transcript_13757:343-1077(+)
MRYFTSVWLISTGPEELYLPFFLSNLLPLLTLSFNFPSCSSRVSSVSSVIEFIHFKNLCFSSLFFSNLSKRFSLYACSGTNCPLSFNNPFKELMHSRNIPIVLSAFHQVIPLVCAISIANCSNIHEGNFMSQECLSNFNTLINGMNPLKVSLYFAIFELIDLLLDNSRVFKRMLRPRLSCNAGSISNSISPFLNVYLIFPVSLESISKGNLLSPICSFVSSTDLQNTSPSKWATGDTGFSSPLV